MNAISWAMAAAAASGCWIVNVDGKQRGENDGMFRYIYSYIYMSTRFVRCSSSSMEIWWQTKMYKLNSSRMSRMNSLKMVGETKQNEKSNEMYFNFLDAHCLLFFPPFKFVAWEIKKGCSRAVVQI